MRNKVMTARPAARKGSGTRAKKTVAVPSNRRVHSAQPIIQMVERKSSRSITDLPKKSGELPVPVATFVF